MRVERFESAAAYREATAPFLDAREAEHHLIIGLTAQLEAGRRFGPDVEYYARVVDERGRTVLVALRTPPMNLILSMCDDPRAIELIARAVLRDSRPPGLLAPQDVAEAFGRTWFDLVGERLVPEIEERIYQCSAVAAPRGVDGAPRPITAADEALVRSWVSLFNTELGRGSLVDNWQQWLDGPPGTAGMWLWEVGGHPVSMSGYGGVTPRGIRVGPVFTPDAQRGRGYASAVVAAQTSWLLADGRDFVFLFTDLANPISNHVYQKIGYTPVADVGQYRLTAEA